MAHGAALHGLRARIYTDKKEGIPSRFVAGFPIRVHPCPQAV